MASATDQDGTYPPLDVLKPVTEGVWIVDSGPLHVFGLTLPIRMTGVLPHRGMFLARGGRCLTFMLPADLKALRAPGLDRMPRRPRPAPRPDARF
jgi:hypothetical protein